jgi:hypothetical protein
MLAAACTATANEPKNKPDAATDSLGWCNVIKGVVQRLKIRAFFDIRREPIVQGRLVHVESWLIDPHRSLILHGCAH